VLPAEAAIGQSRTIVIAFQSLDKALLSSGTARQLRTQAIAAAQKEAGARARTAIMG
jgi:hypothetical protein